MRAYDIPPYKRVYIERYLMLGGNNHPSHMAGADNHTRFAIQIEQATCYHEGYPCLHCGA